MENATKALLIAGAVLIVILIIGVGMMIYNSTTGTVKEAIREADKEADLFNGKFTQFEGKQPLAVVKSLISSVNTSNLNSDHRVTVTYDSVEYGKENDNTNTLEKLRTSLNKRSYSIACNLGNTAFVTNITISDVT